MKNHKIFIHAILLIAILVMPLTVWAQALDDFTEVRIVPEFYNLLISDTGFMDEGGARMIEGEGGQVALIGIGKVFPEKFESDVMPDIIRKGELRARSAIIASCDDIEVSSSRVLYEHNATDSKSEKGSSLSSFFQTSQIRAKEQIQQIPVIGTWWSKSHSTFFVAVGKIINADPAHSVSIRFLAQNNALKKMKVLETEEPFLSLLKISPVLCQNGGVRGYIIDNDAKALIAVAATPINSSLTQARKIARLKAIRSLIGYKEGIEVEAVETLEDQEHMVLSGKGEQRIMLSLFLSVTEEQVSGVIKAMPVVVVWTDDSNMVVHVAIGKIQPAD